MLRADTRSLYGLEQETVTYDPHDDEPLPGAPLRALRWSLQALANAGSGQPPLFPEQTVSPGELATSFEQASILVTHGEAGEVSEPQRTALEAISAQFETLSRDEAEFGVELWTEAAVATSEQWTEVRRLAMDALEAFEWSAADEPSGKAPDAD
jgi:hypothetical protein